MEAGEVTMQMQEYIYLGTTPMYFLGASGRIVGSGRIESPHLRPHLPALLFHLSRADIQPFSLPLPFYAILSLSLSIAACMHRVPPRTDTREIYEQTSPGPQG